MLALTQVSRFEKAKSPVSDLSLPFRLLPGLPSHGLFQFRLYLSIFHKNVYSSAAILARCSLFAAPAWPPSVFS